MRSLLLAVIGRLTGLRGDAVANARDGKRTAERRRHERESVDASLESLTRSR